MSGKPNMPDAARAGRLPRATSTTPRRTPARTPTRGKKVVVIGTNNSAFDICGALWENDADVTMVQRSSTHIVKSDIADGASGSATSTPSGRSRPG